MEYNLSHNTVSTSENQKAVLTGFLRNNSLFWLIEPDEERIEVSYGNIIYMYLANLIGISFLNNLDTSTIVLLKFCTYYLYHYA